MYCGLLTHFSTDENFGSFPIVNRDTMKMGEKKGGVMTATVLQEAVVIL